MYLLVHVYLGVSGRPASGPQEAAPAVAQLPWLRVLGFKAKWAGLHVKGHKVPLKDIDIRLI